MYPGIFDSDFDKYCEDASALRKDGVISAFEALQGWPKHYATNPAANVKSSASTSPRAFSNTAKILMSAARRDAVGVMLRRFARSFR